MAKKSANIMVRVEPDVKAKAEEVMNELGVPASVVVNMLYKHIIRTRGIPFPVNINGEERDLIDEMNRGKGPTENSKENIIEEMESETEQEIAVPEELPEIQGLRISDGAKRIITVI